MESKSPVENDCEAAERFMSSDLCTNKSQAKLGELLWCHGDLRICTIYPQQEINVSSWLTHQYGRTLFPLYTNNRSRTLLQSEYKIHLLVEADLDSYKPAAERTATKIEDYGLIITWTANKNIGLILESDLDTVAKFLIAAMEDQCYINNGLLLKRIETVLVSGKPCVYNNDLLNPPPHKRFIGKADWEAHVDKLRMLSYTAEFASKQSKPAEVTELPGVVIYPENAATEAEIEFMERVVSAETLETDVESQVSTPASSTVSTQKHDKDSQNLTHSAAGDSVSLQNTQTADKKVIETAEATEDVKQIKEKSTDAKSASDTFQQEMSQPAKIMGECKTADAVSGSKGLTWESTAKHQFSKAVKPPNVLIYADSIIAVNNVKSVLETSLGSDKYVIYPLTLEEARTEAWMENAALVVVCGNIGGEIGSQIVEYILRGGKLLALCSDVLHILLPSFKTAEVRENELVHFSYGKWKHVRMMHHIFCYQASPIRTRFSQDHEDIKVASVQPPASASVKDKRGNSHPFDVRVLGTEETWHTPSILLASLPESGGKVVFSQIHLEVDPMQYELEESKFRALKESNATRLEIFNDVLKTHLGIDLDTTPPVTAKYTPAFFLGRHELKLELFEKLKTIMGSNDTLKMANLDVQFCRGTAAGQPASSSLLPIMVHQCPDNFSTIEYFENLSTKELGRLVIYGDTLTSSMDVISGHRLNHGLAVICRQQTRGRGRGKNVWLSPKGCAMFSMQLHVPTNSVLGSHISILQHLIATAVVAAIRFIPGYEEIDLRLKWPNDIYAGRSTKIGGVVLTTSIESGLNVCNAGVGVNLFNSKPTCCINDMIKMYNEACHKSLKEISYEQYFALVFNELERLLNAIQSGNVNALLDIYYKYWIHTDADVTILSASGKTENVKVVGIDEYGFLRVRRESGSTFSVHPDSNRFDALKGLIAPK